MKDYLQRMGRSLQLPVSVLPAAALLVGIGHWLPAKWAIAQYLQIGGNAILGSLAILFAVGLAFGMSEDHSGAAALAGLVAYQIPMYILDPQQMATLLNIKTSAVDVSFTQIKGNVFIGIMTGLVVAALYNRFHNTKLPMAFSFFSGKRLVPIIASLVMLVISALLIVIWPPIYTALVAFGKYIVSLGWIGAGLFGLFNRLLIPTGLHQALNSVFWFNIAGINDIANFWSSTGTKGVTGMYLAGFFPVMMFGLPAGAYAIYRNALPQRKKETGSLMLAAGFASFFTGVTEPLEFSFMFVAWPLYLLHAMLTGLSLAFAAIMHWTAGFTFSAGLVDYLLSLRVPIANMPLMLLVQGVVMAVIYYVTFNFAIKKFNLMTPGREPLEEVNTPTEIIDAADDKFMRQAKQIYAALGGSANLTVVDNCTTRLRLQLKDTAKIETAAIKAAGAVGINVIDATHLQIIIGTEVEFTANALRQLLEQKAPINKTATASTTPKAPVATREHAGENTDFYAVANGQLLDLEQVADPTFAEKMLGDGYAVEPDNNQIMAPVDGEITNVFPTKHAIGIKTATGLEILVHMGIDTVSLDGKPFNVAVQAGQQIRHGELLATMDLAAVQAAGKKITTMIVITNMEEIGYLRFKFGQATVTPQQLVLTTHNK
ncbi:N-acetylglucosamine-specific PTS transporter subunit IIBC [Bombilactobacillus thymidiniphilus]|uniref:N-acetylglucosamine-specific PTS transporter subunit IIBC n=1 Tax=Bombilactobacillus thymidiniphilus TaxID=2923363 RepID=A0ABY4PF33_9LACO|nr:N-acetylglucosamine-specific PTS transporter subunit IIBC [Bombilactobacillus thymidiniphilus]UQS84180.1 N-acetylglucosamine-specific PTS transporter subunit IIBC [Bombilactobacillus thymidiniphilus]